MTSCQGQLHRCTVRPCRQGAARCCARAPHSLFPHLVCLVGWKSTRSQIHAPHLTHALSRHAPFQDASCQNADSTEVATPFSTRGPNSRRGFPPGRGIFTSDRCIPIRFHSRACFCHSSIKVTTIPRTLELAPGPPGQRRDEGTGRVSLIFSAVGN